MMCTWNPSGLWTVFETSCEFIIFSKSKRFLQNKSNISLNKGNIKDITKYKINKITDRNEQTNNLSSIDSESQEKNLLEF